MIQQKYVIFIPTSNQNFVMRSNLDRIFSNSNWFKIFACVTLASILVIGVIATPIPASALISGACNCVIFRIDDIQDYYLNTVQGAVMDKFTEKNANATLPIIMNFIGNDQFVVQKVNVGHQSKLFEITVHGWNHDDYSLLTLQTQTDTLKLAGAKMQTLWGQNSTVFVLPYNSYNEDTLQAMQTNGMRIVSSETSQEIEPIYQAIPLSDIKDSHNIYHLPQSIEYKNVTGSIPIKTPLSTILSVVNSTINSNGYAVITMHPSDFAQMTLINNNTAVSFANAVNATELANLDTLITTIKNTPGYSIHTFSYVAKVALPATVDNVPPIITPPHDISFVSAQALTVISLGTATATDNFDPSPVITNNATSQISNGFPQGTTRVLWTATDNSGRSSTAIQYVTVGPVQDTTAPTVTITKPTAGQTIQGTNLGYNLRINGTASDAITVPTSGVKIVYVNTDQTPNVAATPNSPGNWTKWTYILHVAPGNPPSPVTALDAVSNDFWNNTGFLPLPGPITGLTINLNGPDTTKPELIAPANIIKNATGPLTPVTLGTPKVYDNADLNPVVSSSIGPGESSGFPPGITLVTWTAKDASNNVATAIQSINIINSAPAITLVAPVSNSRINGAFIANYTLSEVVGSGNFTFTRTGGTADAAPHFYNFTTSDKLQGAHLINSTTLQAGFGNSLVNGTVYTMKVSARDTLTLVPTSVTNTGITFDTTVPVISSVTPVSSTVNSSFKANFTLSEPVSTGSITFARTAGTADPAVHFYNFTTGDKTLGAHSITRSSLETGFNNTLVGGANYTMTIAAKDLALNSAVPVSRTSIQYINTAPVITLVTPASGSQVNAFSANYTLSASTAVTSGTITFTRTGGASDALTHTYNFAPGDKTLGAHSITRSSLETGFGNTLVGGAVYTMTITATDAAANVSTPVVKTLIFYDTAGPAVVLSTPTNSTSTTLFTVTAHFTKPVTGADIGDFVVVGGTKSNFVTVSPDTYTVNITPTAALITINMASSSAIDIVGNGNTAATQISVTYTSTLPATVSGIVFADADGNGLQGIGDSGIAGRTVILVDGNGTRLVDKTTNATGGYTFTGVAPGTLLVQTAPVPQNHLPSTGFFSYARPTIPGGIPSTVNFPLTPIIPQNRATVNGTVFEDTNNNGVQNQGEPGIAGVQVFVVDFLTLTQTTVLTNVNGAYTATGILPDVVLIQAAPIPAGHLPHTVTYSYQTLAQGSTTTVNFALRPITPSDQGTIIIDVFDDTNSNGIKDISETGVQNAVVFTFELLTAQADVKVTGPTGVTTHSGLIPDVVLAQINAAVLPPGFSTITTANGGFEFISVAPNSTTTVKIGLH